MRRLLFVRARLVSGCIAAVLLGSGSALAQGPRDHAIPSCYDQLREYAPRNSLGDLTVIVDQTTFMDARLRQIVRDTVDRLIKPETSVSIAAFSANMQGRYLDVLVSGKVEPRVAAKQRDFLPKRELLEADQCLGDQLAFARRLAAKTLDSAFSVGDPNIARSDILVALSELSRRIRGAGQVNGRIVIIVSDMLENSSIANFYHARQLRNIDAGAELRRVAASGIKADFLGARVVVIGAGGVSSPSAHGRSYRDPRAMLALEDFWRRWFASSNADVVEFGKPTPLVEIEWSEPGSPGMSAQRADRN
jgi:hypothetical protein